MPETAINSGYDFSRSKRLLNSRDFQTVFDGAQYKIGHSHLLLAGDTKFPQPPSSGLGYRQKKNVRRAVGRNRIKRVARECFRLNQQQIGPLDIILLARRGIAELDHNQLHRLVKESLRRLSKKVSAEQKKARQRGITLMRQLITAPIRGYQRFYQPSAEAPIVVFTQAALNTPFAP